MVQVPAAWPFGGGRVAFGSEPSGSALKTIDGCLVAPPTPF
jgi:hypothetical protein